jgi:hypothetical protein
MMLLIESQPRQNYLPYLELSLKAIASLIAIIGAYITVLKYLNEKKKANETAKIESQRPFSEKQQAIYFDLLETTSLIANRVPTNATQALDDPKRSNAIEHFWVLFWGGLPLVANQEVAAAADKFSEALANPMDFIPLRNASMDLARACRHSLGEAWNIGLEQFPKSNASTARN